jgi:hypothetical protein
MRAVVVPWLIGSIACVALTVMLWFSLPLLLTPAFGTSWLGWFPAIVALPPLFVGGYTAARFTRSRYRLSYAVVGAVVGVTASLIIFSVFGSGFVGSAVWLVGPVVAAAVVSALGALWAARRSRPAASAL